MTQIQKLKGSHECYTLVNVTSLVIWRKQGEIPLTTPMENAAANKARGQSQPQPMRARKTSSSPDAFQRNM